MDFNYDIQTVNDNMIYSNNLNDLSNSLSNQSNDLLLIENFQNNQTSFNHQNKSFLDCKESNHQNKSNQIELFNSKSIKTIDLNNLENYWNNYFLKNEDLKKEERRRSACKREQIRMKAMNQAFNNLRIKLPSNYTNRKRLSKIESLRCAINYIEYLKSILINNV